MSEQQLLLVGSYAAADAPGIYAFRFDPASGALAPAGTFSGIVNPSYLVVHPNRRWVYAVSEAGAGDSPPSAVWALRLDPDSAAIEPINQQPTNGDWPCHLRIDSTGEWLIASNYGSGSAAIYRIQADGSLSPMTDFVQHHGVGANPDRQEGPHAHSATFTPDNRFVLVADLGIDQLLVYALDRAEGKLRPHAAAHTRPGAGPRHLAFDPSGRRVYLGNELDNTAVLLEYDPAAATLHALQTIDTVPAGAPLSYVADVHIAPAGDRLYISNRGHDSIAVFGVASNGQLELLATPSCGGKWPRNFALAPGGGFMLVANQHSDNVAVLPITPGDGELGAPVASAAVPKASCVQFVGA
jgi:6-phosphogluconolactonase